MPTTTIIFDVETQPGVALDPRVVAMAAKREQSPEMFASLCPVLCRIACIAMMHAESGKETAFADPDEAKLLTDAFGVLAKADRIVTFNGRGFDLPVLLHRARINGVAIPAMLEKAAWQKPWENAPHIDVMNLASFGGAGGRYSLEAYCIGYGIENPKANCDGTNVAEMMAAGRVSEVTEYCAADVRATAELWGCLTGQGRIGRAVDAAFAA